MDGLADEEEEERRAASGGTNGGTGPTLNLAIAFVGVYSPSSSALRRLAGDVAGPEGVADCTEWVVARSRMSAKLGRLAGEESERSQARTGRGIVTRGVGRGSSGLGASKLNWTASRGAVVVQGRRSGVAGEDGVAGEGERWTSRPRTTGLWGGEGWRRWWGIGESFSNENMHAWRRRTCTKRAWTEHRLALEEGGERSRECVARASWATVDDKTRRMDTARSETDGREVGGMERRGTNRVMMMPSSSSSTMGS